jgi:protein-disulfide isomerase
MTQQRSLALLLIGAVVLVVAVFGALHFAGTFSSSSDAPAVAMNKGDVEKIVRNYLLENPEVILEAMDKYQSKQQDERIARMRDGAKEHASALFREPEAIIAGNPKGDITMVEFFDYHCPYCKRVKQDVSDLLKQDGNIRLVLKEFPILSKESETAARAAIASIPQGKYWDFHLALMGAEDLSDEAIFAAAKSVGINVDKLKVDMKDPKIQKRLDDTQGLARTLGIDATPTFFVGDEPMTGAKTLQELKEAVAAARKARPS